MMNINNYLLAIIICLILSVFSFSKDNFSNISGKIDLSINQQKISAKLKYEYLAQEPGQEVKFYLNKNFNVLKVECKDCLSFKFDLEAKPLPTLTIPLRKTLQKGEKIQFKIDYEGDISSMFHKEYQFLELGLDWFWYPVHQKIGQVNFKYQLEIKTDTDFDLAGNGQTARKGRNWTIRSNTEDFDIAIVLGQKLNFKRHQQNGYNLQVVSKNISDDTSRIMLKNITETLDFYNSTFGKHNPQRDVVAVIRPFPEIQGQGGYFRKGYFILPKTDNAQNMFFPVAHELAHYWWGDADQQNAWLNESFAEYCAMMAVRKLKDEKSFDEILERKQKLNVNLPPIYGFDRTKNQQQTPLVLYVKGALKLYDLEQDLGEQKMLDFFQKVSERKITQTDKLIEFIAEFFNPAIADKFLDNLKK